MQLTSLLFIKLNHFCRNNANTVRLVRRLEVFRVRVRAVILGLGLVLGLGLGLGLVLGL